MTINDVSKNTLRMKYVEALNAEIKELIDPETGKLSLKYSHVINCPICDSKEYSTLFEKSGYTFVRCGACEMVFTNPQVKSDYLNELYGKSIANDLWQKVTMSEEERRWKEPYYLDHLNLILKYTKHPHPKLLDIGCATGQFLEVASRATQYCTGIELNEQSYNYCINKLKLNVERKTLEECGWENKFDVITLFGVLEHLPAPKKILQSSHIALTEGGIFFAVVPNIYSLHHMILKSESITFDGRNHLLYFSTKTLRNLIESNGFEVLHLDTVLDGYHELLRHIQFSNSNDDKNYLDDLQSDFFDKNHIAELCKKHNLGLRIRILARKI